MEAAAQEDVDYIGLSFQGADHIPLLKMVTKKMQEEGLHHVKLVAGGNIPLQDIPQLQELGVDAVFPPGTPMNTITEFFQQG
jgi:methylmalonyl-CoA mutase C-terminal domain/subunit